MEKTKIVVNNKVAKNYYADILIYCIDQHKKDKPRTANLQHEILKKAVRIGDFTGDAGEQILVYEGLEKDNIKSKRLVYLGVGLIKKNTKGQILEEIMRKTGGIIAELCKKNKSASVCVVPPEGAMQNNPAVTVHGLTEGVYLGDYTFKKYKSQEDKKKQFAGIKEIRIIVGKQLALLRKTAESAKISAISACHARDMANEPGNAWTPQSFAEYAGKIAKEHNFKCTVFDSNKLKKLGMGGILAVNKGSSTPAKMVILEYRKSTASKTVLLVGKGLTFDSGGISIKPAAGMEDMKYDMCGGAAVMGAMNVVGYEQPDCNVIAIVPTTDNMSGSDAVKPGDIIYHYNKKTSEVINTDAEGRLILADALAYGVEQYDPDYIIDLATLTGAVIVGLGHHHSGLFSNDDRLANLLIKSGVWCGEPLWRLPLGEEYKKQIESKIADIKNTGGKGAGAITAAEYLHHFVDGRKWAHIDIAGTAWNFTEKTYIPKEGPSGIGVRTLAHFIRNLK